MDILQRQTECMKPNPSVSLAMILGLKESKEKAIELVNTPVEAFSSLLQYIYGGQLSLERMVSSSSQRAKDELIDLFTLADRYGFEHLLEALSAESEHFLTISNVIDFYEAADFYNLKSLAEKCLDFLDENSLLFLKESKDADQALIRSSASTLKRILSRDTFWAPEVLIFIAVEKWLIENQRHSTSSTCDKEKEEEIRRDVSSVIRLDLIDSHKLISRVKESSLFSWAVIKDVIHRQEKAQENDISPTFCSGLSRYGLVKDRNIFRKDIHVMISGSDVDMGEREVARHDLRDSSSGILIGFEKPYLINMIRWKITATLVNPITSPFPAYDAFSIETSVDGNNWSQLIQREQRQDIVLFWSERAFYLRPRVVQYIRIKGYAKRIRFEPDKEYSFQLKQLHIAYTSNQFDLTPDNKALIPRFNCSLIPFSDRIARDDYFRTDCDMSLKYKFPRSHKINTGKCIEFALEQMSLVNLITLLLSDEDPRVSYSFTIESSVDDRNWTTIVDQRFIQCKSWQQISIAPTLVFFIRIKGTNVLNDDQSPSGFFRLVHFECRFR